MSSQPPYGQGSWQQPPAGPPGQGPAGPPGPPPGPPGPPGPPPPGGVPPGGVPPGGGPPPPGGPYGPGGPGGPPYGPGEPPGRSKTPLIAGIVAAVVVLVGVGVLLYFLVFSDDDEAAGDYCGLLEENQETVQQILGNSGDADVEEAVALIHDLRSAAPEEVADEWALLDDPFTELEEALEEQGLSLSDVESETPPEAEEAVQQFLEEIESVDLSAVGQTLADHAKDECDVDIQ